MRGHIGIAQDVGLRLQILQTVLDYVTDADDTGDLAVAQHRHVSYAVARHQLLTRLTLSSGNTVITPYRMISFTGIEVALSP